MYAILKTAMAPGENNGYISARYGFRAKITTALLLLWLNRKEFKMYLKDISL